MTQDEIIRMAREAGLLEEGEAWVSPHQEAMERFAALVAAHEREKHLNLANEVAWSVALSEREACAKVCDELQNDAVAKYFDATAGECAAAIRARGEK